MKKICSVIFVIMFFSCSEIYIPFDTNQDIYMPLDTNKITVINPNHNTVWKSESFETWVEWTGGEGPVCIEIFKGDENLGYYVEMTTNDGSEGMSFKTSWGTGDDYRIKVTDTKGYYGWSEYFLIY